MAPSIPGLQAVSPDTLRRVAWCPSAWDAPRLRALQLNPHQAQARAYKVPGAPAAHGLLVATTGVGERWQVHGAAGAATLTSLQRLLRPLAALGLPEVRFSGLSDAAVEAVERVFGQEAGYVPLYNRCAACHPS